MKLFHFVCSAVVSASVLGAMPMERETTQLAEKLSAQYRKDHDVSIRRNLAVLALEYDQADKAAAQAAETARELLNVAFSRSNVFALVDRANLESVLKEVELRQSGLTAGSNGDTQLVSADVLLTGRVTRNTEGYQVAARLTDVGTSKQYAAALQVSSQESQAASDRRLDREFAFNDGIGLSIFSMTTLSGNAATAAPIPGERETGISTLPGIELRYRFSPYIMAGAGFGRVYGQAQYLGSVTSTATGNGSQAQTDPMRIVAQGFSTPLNLYLTLPLTRRWQIFVMPGIDFHSLSFHGYFLPSKGNGFGANEVGPFLTQEFFALRLLVGVEFFVTPRMALSLRAGYTSAAFALATTPLRHLNLPDPISIDLGGFTYAPALTVYF